MENELNFVQPHKKIKCTFEVTNMVEVLQDMRQKVLEIPTHIKDIGYYQQREIHSYKGDVLELIDSYIKEYGE